jgi:antitoxin ParD1/3/4/toxin ParE1/3/4
MKGYELTSAAENDIFEIWAHIAARNVQAADKLEADIREACFRVAQRPELGHFRRDLTKRHVRFLAVRAVCLIVYHPETQPLRILRVLHGARDAANQLKDLPGN